MVEAASFVFGMMKPQFIANLSVSFDHLLECWRLEVSNKKRPGRRTSLLLNVLCRVLKDNKLRFLLTPAAAWPGVMPGTCSSDPGQGVHGKSGRVCAVGLQAKKSRAFARLSYVVGPHGLEPLWGESKG